MFLARSEEPDEVESSLARAFGCSDISEALAASSPPSLTAAAAGLRGLRPVDGEAGLGSPRARAAAATVDAAGCGWMWKLGAIRPGWRR
eukprot:SAG22_NODE_1414_length_4475_cov_10.897395_5_plen_89_part_00